MSGESILKSGRKENFTVLYNSMIKDNRLSLRSKGLFAIMASLPDNWNYTVSGLAAYVGVSKDVVRAIIKELQDVGYLAREQSHGERGKFGGNIYILQDVAPPLSGNTDNGESRQRSKPSPVNPTQPSKDLTKERLKETPIAPREILDRATEYAAGDKELLDAISGLLENRAKMDKPKPVRTLRAIDGILRDLDNHSGGVRAAKLQLLNKAIVRNWLTVYPLKSDELPGGSTNRVEENEAVRYI